MYLSSDLRQISLVEEALIGLGSGAPQTISGSLDAVGIPVAIVGTWIAR